MAFSGAKSLVKSSGVVDDVVAGTKVNAVTTQIENAIPNKDLLSIKVNPALDVAEDSQAFEINGINLDNSADTVVSSSSQNAVGNTGTGQVKNVVLGKTILNTGGREIPKWKWGNNPISDAEAAEAYQAIAASKTDVAAIARYMNLNERSVERLHQVKNYLFKGNNDIPDFTPDPAIATAWNRMRSGSSDLATRQRDMLLLKHEVAEMRIKQQTPDINHTEAHRLANERYNWQETIPWEELGF